MRRYQRHTPRVLGFEKGSFVEHLVNLFQINNGAKEQNLSWKRCF